MASSHKKSEFINLREIFEQYKKKWYWFAISAFVCAAVAFVFVKGQKPKYQVKANVLISQEDGGGMSNFGGLGDLFGSSGYVEDEIFVVTSHTVLRNVVKQLGLYTSHTVSDGFLSKTFKYKDYPIQVYTEPAILDTLKASVLFDITVKPAGLADIKVKVKGDKIEEVEDTKLPATLTTDYGKFIVDRTKFCPKDKEISTKVTITGYDAAAEELSEDVSSSIASKKSNVIQLSIVTTDPEYGSDVLNAIITQYNDRGIYQKNLQSSKTAKFIDDRLALISGDLSSAEADIQGYKQNQGIVDVSTEASYNIGVKSEAEKALIKAQTENEIIKMTRDFLHDPTKAYELIPASNEIPGVGSSVSTYNSLILRRLELMTNAKGNNAALRTLNEQIDAMRSSIMTSLDRAYQNSNVEIRDIRAQLGRAEGKLGNIPTQEREFLNLKRQQEVKQQLYLFLLQRREETAMLLANAVPKGEIIDEAFTLRDPVGLSKKMIVLIALLFGMCIPPVILWIKKLLRTKFETRKEVEELTDVPVLGEMCIDRSGNQLAVTAHDTSSTSELFRLMRSNLQFVLNGQNDKVVLMTSTRSGEGKSFISINMAASLALLGKRVLLIGMDIRNPQLGKYLGLKTSRGLTNYLSDPSVKLEDIIIKEPPMPNLDIIEAGPIPPNPGELLTSPAVDELFGRLREIYDYIIVDSAPVGMVSDTFNLSRISDATIYVCRANYTTLSDIQYINDLYEDNRLKKMTLVVNGTSAHTGYGYGYGKNKRKHKHRK